jgi:TolB protein
MYRYRRPPVNLARWSLLLLVIAALVAAGLVLSLPRVVATSPQGINLSARSPFTISFSGPMDPASVESRIRVEPGVAGAFSWSGETLTFVPETEWPIGGVRVSFAPGASARNGLPMLFGAQWEFSVGAPAIAFLMRTGDTPNLWIIPITGLDPVQVTDERFGVERFAVSPDGSHFVYTALRADGGTDLKRINRDGTGLTGLVDCPEDRCTAPAYSGDGRRIAFERHPLDQPEYSTVEVLDLIDGSRLTLEADASHSAGFPRFARDGRLAYLDLLEQAIVIHDFAGSGSTRIPGLSGEMAAWSPDGQYLVFPFIVAEPPPTPLPGTPAPVLQIDTFFSHLRRMSVGSRAIEDLSGQGAVEDASPVFSAAGDWIAFARKALEQDRWTPGRQLWLMRADGSDARALTHDPLYNHSGFVWSADGQLIVYVRFDVTDPASTTEIWMIGTDGAAAQQLVSGGYLPEWLP